jgi:hypothetical protein
MSLPLSIPIAMSAIQALIRFRGRLDTILSLNETGKGLPFALPQAPQRHGPHIDPMIEFFRGDLGKSILAIRGLAKEWEIIKSDPREPEVQAELLLLLEAYYEATDTMPQLLGPDMSLNRLIVSKGPSREMRLAYYVVESHRLSRNPAVTRVLLAAADTLLEFGTDAASLFVSDPRTRGLVETLLRRFAVEQDWDEASSDVIFKALLEAAALAALENRGSFADEPVLRTLFDALGEVQQEMGADFVAKLITNDGFRSLASRFLIRAADQPGLLPGTPFLKETLASMLRVAGQNLDGILGDPKAIAGVLEAGIAAAAGAAISIIEKKLADEPLLAVVLKAVAAEFKNAGVKRVLFRKVGNGELFTALYQASLMSLAANPDAIASQAKLKKHVATLIAAFAEELSKKKPVDALSIETVRALAVRGLEVLSQEPAFLASHGELAASVLGGVLSLAASAQKDGLTTADLLEIAGETVRLTSTRLNLLEMNDNLRAVLESIGLVLSDRGLSRLTTGRGRKELFFAAFESVSVNPRTWNGFAEKELAEPLVTGIIRAFAADPSGLLSGPALIPAFQQVLRAAASRGRALLDGATTPKAFQKILSGALGVADREIGTLIDGEVLPEFLRRVVLSFLAAPFDPGAKTDIDDWFKGKIPGASMIDIT